MARNLSHTELRSLTSCEARWDFAYGDALAGSSLVAKITAPRLREGRAWGRAVAAWHVSDGDDQVARDALAMALEDDAEEQREEGVYLPDEHAALHDRLASILGHYMATSDPLRLIDPERHFDVAIPSRTGRRSSNRYRLHGYLDGVHVDDDGRYWIVEFKLRDALSTVEDLALDRQGRHYAWAWSIETGSPVSGVIYDERLNETPKAPRINKDGRPSADKRQLCTEAAYVLACREAGLTPDPETAFAFSQRPWQRRERIIFRPGEIAETGAELVALARRVAELEAGRTPVRTASPLVCRSCFFRAICPDPSDVFEVEASYRRQPAKRNRPVEVAA